MKLSDIKGERALDVMADAMELAGDMMDDGSFGEFAEAVKEAQGDKQRLLAFLCRVLPKTIRAHKRKVISIMAAIQGVDAEEYAKSGDVVSDVIELLTSDGEALGFLSSRQESAES